MLLWSSLLLSVIVNVYLFQVSRFVDESRSKQQPVVKAVEAPRPTGAEKRDQVSKDTISLIFTGDVMLGRTVMTKSMELGDYLYPFRKTSDLLSASDLTIINLENPIVNDCPVHTGGFTFCSQPGSTKALKYAGVDIVNLANNHTLNWGKEGLEETKDLLDEQQIGFMGYEDVLYKTVKGTRLAFVGFDFVTNQYFLSDAQLKMISDAAAGSDFLVVSAHWGNEYKESANNYQRNMARRFVELGADLIIGHHPHWMQDVECFDVDEGHDPTTGREIRSVLSFSAEDFKAGKGCEEGSVPVYYSLGNFVFDQMWSEETKKGGALKIDLLDGNYSGDTFYPTYMKEWAQPEFVNEKEGFFK